MYGAALSVSVDVNAPWGSMGKEVARKAMYVTVSRYEVVPDPREARRQVDEDFVPILSEVPGFVAYYWGDAGDGVMLSTGVFEDRSGA
jgi:hypothetical protein